MAQAEVSLDIETAPPMPWWGRTVLEWDVRGSVWKNAAINSSKLSEVELTPGRLPDAAADARRAIAHANQRGDAFMPEFDLLYSLRGFL